MVAPFTSQMGRNQTDPIFGPYEESQVKFNPAMLPLAAVRKTTCDPPVPNVS